MTLLSCSRELTSGVRLRAEVDRNVAFSLGLTIAQLSARLRCAECGGQLHSVKPWRLEDVVGKPLGRRV